jgi:hypothetical protein
MYTTNSQTEKEYNMKSTVYTPNHTGRENVEYSFDTRDYSKVIMTVIVIGLIIAGFVMFGSM